MEKTDPIPYEYEGKKFSIIPSMPFGFLEVDTIRELGKFTDVTKAQEAIRVHVNKAKEATKKSKVVKED